MGLLQAVELSFGIIDAKLYGKLEGVLKQDEAPHENHIRRFTHMSATHKLLSVLLIQLGYKVRSEVQIGAFQADVVLPEENLVLDILGPVHFLTDLKTEVVNSKAIRQLFVRKGFKVLCIEGELNNKLFQVAIPMEKDAKMKGTYIQKQFYEVKPLE